MPILQFTGGLVVGSLRYLGEVAILSGGIAESLAKGKLRWRIVLEQIVETGFRSQPVVMVTGAFTDVLRSMGVHPIDYLVTPRVIAMVLAIPLLIAESAALGIGASVLVGVGAFDVNPAYWMNQMSLHTDLTDIAIALVKGVVFGLLIVIISCHQGLRASGGAVGVGRATTRAMVYSALAVLIFNFFLTLAMNLIFPAGLSRH